MAPAEYLGLIAGLFTTFSTVPQIVRVFKLKSAREISTTFTVMLLLGMLIWITYGIAGKHISIIIWNSIGAALMALLLLAKIKYDR